MGGRCARHTFAADSECALSRWLLVVVVAVGASACRTPRLAHEVGTLAGHAGPAALLAPSFQPAIGLETMDRRDDRARAGGRHWVDPVTFRSRPSAAATSAE